MARLSNRDLNKILLAKQREYRRAGKDANWLASYARGFKHRNFSK